MASGQSYPSPTEAQTRTGAGPFYGNGTASPQQNGKDGAQEVPPHLQLSGELEHINPELQESSHDYMEPQQHIQTHSASEQLAQSVMSLANPYPQMPHATEHALHNAAQAAEEAAAALAAKQRSKVSRACDQCRRKKIRCDATGENETCSCTACKKSNLVCQFSRTPQKRGPSKGYIKELADRVTTLERERRALGADDTPQPSGPGLNQDEMTFLAGVEAGPYSPAPTTAGQKRTHSVSEGAFSDHYTASGRVGFPPQELMYLEDEAINAYFVFVHMTLPFLSRDASIIRRSLQEATPATKDSFVAAFECTMHGTLFSPLSELTTQYTPKRAYELFVNSNWMDTANLIQVQSLLLLLIESSNRGTQVIHGGNGNSPWQFLNEAVNKGKSIDLFTYALYPPPEEPDNHYVVSRSIVLTITILDAFLSLGNKKLGSALEPSLVTMWEADIQILGQRTYLLARMARILTRLAHTRIADSRDDHDLHRPTRVTGSTSKPVRIMPEDTDVILRLKTADQDLLQSRELPDDPVLQMAFWYTRAQIEITYYPMATAQNILFPVRRIVELLSQMTAPNPLTYHFSAFAAHLLLQLCAFANTKDEAMVHLQALDETLSSQVPAHDSQSFDAGIRDVVRNKRGALLSGSDTSPTMGLEHLANAAVGSEEPNGGVQDSSSALRAAAEAAAKAAQLHMSSAVNFDGSSLSQDGYLTALLVHGG
ncbi:hypothetical protein EJ08DRAFT_735111 [Tothia fuscella]|uniref:Zn(2)-C6 fungal-type domain-containing protein n=1 Tax=Tothia fuscella TaxID=1048955 RepID=A0A9P4TWK3_9PEZI|nr:hypothetical protein EJ08DRAFT_735111 [Tothia fuscella]